MAFVSSVRALYWLAFSQHAQSDSWQFAANAAAAAAAALGAHDDANYLKFVKYLINQSHRFRHFQNKHINHAIYHEPQQVEMYRTLLEHIYHTWNHLNQ